MTEAEVCDPDDRENMLKLNTLSLAANSRQTTLVSMHRDRLYYATSATTPLAPSTAPEPVIVIGLPRSGTTFLAHALTAMKDLFVFDDLYCLQKAHALRCDGPMTREQLAAFIDHLGWSTRARIRHATHFTRFPMTWTDVDRLCDSLLRLYEGTRVTWPQLVNEYLSRLAFVHGKNRWGYKTPQDFRHVRLLRRLFPGCRFVFVVRDPRNVMASYKFNRSQDGKPGQYHPMVYALYWRMAIRTIDSADPTVPILRIRFEDLVTETDTTAAAIATFADTVLSAPVAVKRTNTSFTRTSRRGLTYLERYLCEHICAREMERFGYAMSAHSALLRITDIADLLATTARFVGFQGARVLKDPVARVKVGGFLRSLWTQPRP